MTLLLIALLALPSAETVLQKAIAVDKEQTAVQHQYAYTEEVHNQQVDKDGKLGAIDTKTYDVIFIEGEPFRKLTQVNGQPLAAKEQQKVDHEMQKTAEERRRKRRSGITHIERSVSLGGMAELLKFFDNRVAGEETLRGRQVWVIESTPKPGYKPQGKQEEEIMSWRHKSWYDQQDGAQMQITSTVIRAVNGFQAGSEYTWEYDKGSEECWLLRKVSSKVEMQLYKMVHARAVTTQSMTNYKKFDVASTITTGDIP